MQEDLRSSNAKRKTQNATPETQNSKPQCQNLKTVNIMENNKLDNLIPVFLLLIFMTDHSLVNLAFELLLVIYLLNEYFIKSKM